MKGVGWFLLKHTDETDHGRLVSKLNEAGTAALDRRARAHMSVMGGNLWQNHYRAIVDYYNEKLTQRNKLEWRLRGSTRWEATERTPAGRKAK
jgi:hypothetical protein